MLGPRWPEGGGLGGAGEQGLPSLLPAGPAAALANLRAGEPRGRRRGRARRGGSQWHSALSAAPPPGRPPRPGPPRPAPPGRTARPEPRSASPPPGGGARTLAARAGRQTRPVGDFLRTRAPRPRRKMQTFLKGKRVGYWLSEKKIKKLNFQAFAELCR